jgi:hypothetical protein
MIDDADEPTEPRTAKPSSDPAIYLPQPTTGDERLLGHVLGLQDDEPAPWRAVAKLAVRVHRQALWTGRIDAIFRRGKRIAIAGIAAAVTNIAALGAYWLHADEARVAEVERATAAREEFAEYRKATEAQTAELRLDIRELRAALHRLSGDDPKSDVRHPPEKLSGRELPHPAVETMYVERR